VEVFDEETVEVVRPALPQVHRAWILPQDAADRGNHALRVVRVLHELNHGPLTKSTKKKLFWCFNCSKLGLFN